MISSVLFDLDGTLIDSNASHDFAFRSTLYDISYEAFQNFNYDSVKGMSTKQAFVKMLPFENQDTINKCIKYKQDLYIQLIEGSEIDLYYGCLELLNFLKSMNIRIYLVTGSSKKSVEMIINTYTLNFDGIICASDFCKGKPDPEPYLTCLNKFNINTYEALAIEDSISGVYSGLRAKLKTFGVHNHEIKDLSSLWFSDLYELTTYFQATLSKV
jgi:beta-phosphoglucomutase